MPAPTVVSGTRPAPAGTWAPELGPAPDLGAAPTLALANRPPAGGRPRVRALVLLFVVEGVLLLRMFALELVAIPSLSMSPTLRPGEHVLTEKVSRYFGAPSRGELVTFARPGSGELTLKRVHGLAGDVVEIRDGRLYVNDRSVDEPYVDQASMDSVYFGPVTVPAASVFVLGDDRADSQDSRDFGPVPESAVVGHPVLRLWPPTRLGAP